MFDSDKLSEVVKIVIRNLDKIIDINDYPVETSRASNIRHWPVGLGVQGLADTFILLGLAFDSAEAKALNKCGSCSPLPCTFTWHPFQTRRADSLVSFREIFETIYCSALTASNELARAHGPHESYQGSPVSKGILQFDMWGVSVEGSRWDWPQLRASIKSMGCALHLIIHYHIINHSIISCCHTTLHGHLHCYEALTRTGALYIWGHMCQERATSAQCFDAMYACRSETRCSLHRCQQHHPPKSWEITSASSRTRQICTCAESTAESVQSSTNTCCMISLSSGCGPQTSSTSWWRPTAVSRYELFDPTY